MSAAPGAVLVTGATGFLGGALVRELCAAGLEVHVLARPGASRAGLAQVPVHWHGGDLLDPASLAAAARATAARAAQAACIHAAAVISYKRGDAVLQREVNVQGTRHVLDAARAAGMARLLFVSSVVCVGDARGDEVLSEDAPFRPPPMAVDYVTTKRAAERLALAAVDDLEVIVVNPGAIFGPSVAGAPRIPNTTRFLQAIADGTSGPFAPPGTLSVVGVEDVARGTLLALERGTSGRRYLLTESSWRLLDLFRLGARRSGVRPVHGAVPAPLWRALVLGARGLDRLRPLELATPQALSLLGLHYRFTSERARRELGWSPAPFEQVLDAVFDAGARVSPRGPGPGGRPRPGP